MKKGIIESKLRSKQGVRGERKKKKQKTKKQERKPKRECTKGRLEVKNGVG